MDDYDNITENIIMIFPLFRSMIMKVHCNEECINPLKSQYPVLGILKRKGEMSMSELCNNLGLSKSNMTSIVNKLIDEQKVERIYDGADRRIIKIKITEKGFDILKKARATMLQEFKNKLSYLSAEDLNKLSNNLKDIKEILTKVTENENNN